jgi:hypothetical protein
MGKYKVIVEEEPTVMIYNKKSISYYDVEDETEPLQTACQWVVHCPPEESCDSCAASNYYEALTQEEAIKFWNNIGNNNINGGRI